MSPPQRKGNVKKEKEKSGKFTEKATPLLNRMTSYTYHLADIINGIKGSPIRRPLGQQQDKRTERESVFDVHVLTGYKETGRRPLLITIYA